MFNLKKKLMSLGTWKNLEFCLFFNISFYFKIHKNTHMEDLNWLKAEVKPIVVFSLIVYRCLFALYLFLLSVQL